MKIAVSVETKDGLDSVVAHHFGRCPFFALVEVEEDEIKAVDVINNPYYGAHQPGQVPGFIHHNSGRVEETGQLVRVPHAPGMYPRHDSDEAEVIINLYGYPGRTLRHNEVAYP